MLHTKVEILMAGKETRISHWKCLFLCTGCSFQILMFLLQKQGSCCRTLLVRGFCIFLCCFPGMVSHTIFSSFLFHFENENNLLCQCSRPNAMKNGSIAKENISKLFAYLHRIPSSMSSISVVERAQQF